MTTADSQYPLGSDPAELERLDHQGRFLCWRTPVSQTPRTMAWRRYINA